MIHSTKGIVLNSIKYAESSIVVHIYTEFMGKQSYMVNAVRKSKNKGRSVLMQPLTMLEMNVYYNPKKNIQRIKDFKVTKPFMSIPFEQLKRSIAFFITEAMDKSLQEEMANKELFQFLEGAVIMLEESSNPLHFHMLFLAELTKYLGFYPDINNTKENEYFDLQNGVLTSKEPLHRHFLNYGMMKQWCKLFESSCNLNSDFVCSNVERDELIDSLIDYYRLHLHDFGKLKTLDVLRRLYHG